MRKNTNNKGFSLIEAIVTISIVAALAGILIPQFVRYTESRRQQACRANREALLNIYEKAVYDDQLLLEKDDLQMILDASGTKMTTEYTNQASDYLECPTAKEKGHYTAHVTTDMVVYITCDCHPEDVCTLSFDNWVAKADLVLDEDPVIEIPEGGPVEPDGSSEPEETEEPPVDTTETCNTGIWPRPMDSQGRIDERWAKAGLKAGSTVEISSPVHFIDTTGAEIVIVTGPKYVVKYEDAAYPLGKGSNSLPGVVAASGVKYSEANMPVKMDVQEDSTFRYETHYEYVEYKATTEKITKYKYCDYVDCADRYVKEHSHPWSGWHTEWGGDWHKSNDCRIENCPLRYKNTWNQDVHKHGGWGDKYVYNPPKEITEDVKVVPDCNDATCPNRMKETHTHKVPTDQFDAIEVKGEMHYGVYRVSYGDMIELNGVTYIYAVNSGGEVFVSELPKADQKTLGVNYNGWYVVPALTK